MQWVNQRNLRVVLEHMTSELLQKQPDDPMEFMINVLQQTQADNAEFESERPETSASSRPQQPQTTEDEVLKGMFAERDHWKDLYDTEKAKADALEQEIAALEKQLAEGPPPDEQ